LGNSDTIYYVKKDLLNQPTEFIDMIIHHFGRIDILINNCAIASKNNKNYKNNKNEQMLQLNALVPYELSKYSIQKNVKKIINISSASAISYHKDLIDYCLSKNILESMTKHLAYQYYDQCIINCIRLDTAFQTEMSHSLYSEEEYKQFEEVKNVIPLFLMILKMGKESSGKIYSYLRSKENLFLESKLNNNYVCTNNSQFLDTDSYKGKYISNGVNKFSGKDGDYSSEASIQKLEKIIAKHIHVSPENIIINQGGISNAFDRLCAHFIETGDEVICSTLSFQPLLESIVMRGGILKTIQPEMYGEYEINYHLQKIPEMITPMTKMIYLIHPTYIFGDTFHKDEFTNILKKIPSTIPIILDECYYDYLSDDIVTSKDYLQDLFIFGLRTFSKLYGLASTRLGYILCDHRYKQIIYKSFPFKSISSDSIQKATHHLTDTSAMLKMKQEYFKEKIYLKNELQKMNIPVRGNALLLILWISNDKKKVLLSELEKINIILPDYSCIENTLLYTIGPREINKQFLNNLSNLSNLQ